MSRYFLQGYLRQIKRLASNKRKPVVVEHVRYTKRPSPDPIEKARQMCIAMGREIPEALRP